MRNVIYIIPVLILLAGCNAATDSKQPGHSKPKDSNVEISASQTESSVKIGAAMKDVWDAKGSPLEVEPLPSEPWKPPKPDDMTEEEYVKEVNESRNSTAKEIRVYSDIEVYFNFNNRVIEIQAIEK